MLQVLAQLPVLWVWDNVEPVTGFPAGTPSAWTAAEQDDLAGLLRDLAQRTRCKVLLTSRRDEHAWLGDLPARVQLPAMPMRESLQLAAALAARHGHSLAGADWRPLLRYAAGNPLTITVLVGQALRENLTTTADIDGVRGPAAGRGSAAGGRRGRRAGPHPVAGRLAELRVRPARSPTPSGPGWRCCTCSATPPTSTPSALMGDPDTAGEDAVPELAGLDRDAGIALLDRAADIGLLTSLGGGYYQIHPALPWYFTTLFTTTYGQPGEPGRRPRRPRLHHGHRRTRRLLPQPG